MQTILDCICSACVSQKALQHVFACDHYVIVESVCFQRCRWFSWCTRDSSFVSEWSVNSLVCCYVFLTVLFNMLVALAHGCSRVMISLFMNCTYHWNILLTLLMLVLWHVFSSVGEMVLSSWSIPVCPPDLVFFIVFKRNNHKNNLKKRTWSICKVLDLNSTQHVWRGTGTSS